MCVHHFTNEDTSENDRIGVSGIWREEAGNGGKGVELTICRFHKTANFDCTIPDYVLGERKYLPFRLLPNDAQTADIAHKLNAKNTRDFQIESL